MKIFSLYFLSLLLSTNISAQIKTGGGPDRPSKDDTSKDIDPIQDHINAFMRHLSENDTKCSSQERLIKDKDLMQVYLKLALFKNTKSSTAQCDEVNRYLLCLNDEATQKYANRLERMIGVDGYVANKYNIDKSNASMMLRFFSDLGKKVE